MVDVMQAYSPSAGEQQPAWNESKREEGGQAHVAWMLARLKGQVVDQHRSLLLFRFMLLNIVAFTLFGVAYSMGLVEQVVVADKTRLSVGIFIVFLGGFAVCTIRVWQTSRELDKLRDFDPLVPSKAAEYLSLLRGASSEGRGLLASVMRLKLSQRIAVVRHVANSLVILGLIGTVIGFVIALSGVDPEEASNVKAIAPMVSNMIEGMSTALYTTLVGAILNVWLLANHQLLSSGTVKLITGLVEFGETHARS